MKRIIYILLITVSCSAFFTSCTEETVTPNISESDNGGGNGTSDPITNPKP
jgi:hypothetical protein